MAKIPDKQEISQLQQRLQSRTDYSISILLWGLFLFSFISVWAVGALDPINAGFQMAVQLAPLFIFFPLFATIGMVSDRVLVQDKLNLAKKSGSKGTITKNENKWQLNKEDCIRIILISIVLFISLPWMVARLGLSHVLFFQPVHLGEHHGWIGAYILLSIILISKTEKLYSKSIFKEGSIYLLCFLIFWGSGLLFEDFAKEQLNISFPFLVLDIFTLDQLGILAIQITIITILSFLIYYFGWRKYYKKKIE